MTDKKRLVQIEEFHTSAHGRANTTEEERQGHLLGYGVNYEEIGEVVGQYSTAIVELYDGSVIDVPVFKIRFIDNTCSKYSIMKDALSEFVERVDKGEVRSTKTYNKFKRILEQL